MRRRLATLTAAVALGPAVLTGAGAAAGTGSPAAGRAAAPGPAWGTAVEVPGSQSLNKGGQAVIGSVSCPATTACSAGGSYTAGVNGHIPVVQAFVVNKTRGVWRRAVAVPGLAALNTAGRARVTSVSCAAPGNCSAGGYYGDAFDHQQAFVVDEVNGTWGTAREVPGTAALDQGSPGAMVLSLSCAAAGDCSAGGVYSDASDLQQAFVADESGGTWGAAQQVPGTAALNAGGLGATQAVSCAPAGGCSAGGDYTNANKNTQVFVASQTGS